MKFSRKIGAFILVFSFVFYWIHINGHFNQNAALKDSSGVPWLYSSLVTLFSIIAGFIIQKEWDNWNSLIDAVKEEVNALRELWLWSRYLPEESKNKFGTGIKFYLEEMTEGGLMKSVRGERSKFIERAFGTLQDAMFEMHQNNPNSMSTTFSFFSRLIESRTARMRYGSHHVPEALRRTIIFVTTLIIFLCIFIGIQNVWLDYGFTLSVAITAFVIYLVIDDLDNPLEPGNWHLTTEDYDLLLKQIDETEKRK